MQELAIILRAAQLVAHQMHNEASGESFFADHEFLGELYPAYEEAYDGVIERMIGLGMKPDIAGITIDAATTANERYSTNYWQALLGIEKEIRKQSDTYQNGASSGTVNFLQGLNDESEQRTYKIGQRAK